MNDNSEFVPSLMVRSSLDEKVCSVYRETDHKTPNYTKSLIEFPVSVRSVSG